MARPRKFDEQTVVRAARDQFWRTGYTATSLDDLMAATGLGRASIYAAFGDKHALFVRAFADYCGEAVAGVRSMLDGSGRAYDRLVALIRAQAAGVIADVDLQGCLLAKGTAELAGTDTEVAALARHAFEELREALTSAVAQAQAEGDLRADADPQRVAGLLLVTLRGMEAVGKAGADATMLRDTAEDAISALPRVID